MKANKKTWIILSLLLALILVVCLAAWYAWAFATRPLNTSLAALATLAGSGQPVSVTDQPDVNHPLESPTAFPTSLPTPEGFDNPAPAPVLPTPTPAPEAKPICGGPPLMFIQVAGIDEFNLADAIRLVRVDFTKPQVSVLAIQRAMWVTIPHLEPYGIKAMIINASHSYGVHFLGKNMGPYLLAETIALNYGLKSDHYLDVSFDSFVKAVDAVGGVDITLPEAVSDPASTHLYLSAGTHHLDGKTALLFVRMRYSDSDWQRINRQTELLMTLYNKLVDPSMLPRLPELVNQVKGDFQTDLSPVEISQLLCLAANLPHENIKFYEIGQDMVIPTTLNDKARSQIMLPKYDLIRPYFEQFINGDLP
jgi:LCP family protein required for cell wall assembly